VSILIRTIEADDAEALTELLRHAVRVHGEWGDDYAMAKLLE
jgi:hypothetical protein